MHGILLAGLILSALSVTVVLASYPATWRHRINLWWLRHMVYARPIGQHWSPATLALLVMYISSNIMLSLSSGSRPPTVTRRTGLVAMVNIVPLFISHRHEIVSHWLRLPLSSYCRLHRFVAWTVAGLTAAHVALAYQQLRLATLKDRQTVCFILIGGAMLLLLAMSIPWGRTRLYETAVNFHYLVSPIVLGGVWYHVPNRSVSLEICVIVALAIHTFGIALDVVLTLWRQRWFAKTALITLHGIPQNDVYEEVSLAVAVKLERHDWQPSAGHYMLLWVNDGTWRSYFQRHPFVALVVSVTSRGKPDNEVAEQRFVTFSVQVQEGFTLRLCRHLQEHGHIPTSDRHAHEKDSRNPFDYQQDSGGVTENSPAKYGRSKSREIRVRLSGPFGRCIPIQQYHTLVAVAHHERIVSILPYLSVALIPGHSRILQRVHLVWQVSEPRHTLRLQPFLDHLWGQAKDVVKFDITIYDESASAKTAEWQSVESEGQRRLQWMDGNIRLSTVLQREAVQAGDDQQAGATLHPRATEDVAANKPQSLIIVTKFPGVEHQARSLVRHRLESMRLAVTDY